MDFEIVGEISDVETIAIGSRISDITHQSVQELVLEPHVRRLVTKLPRELPDDPARIA